MNTRACPICSNTFEDARALDENIRPLCAECDERVRSKMTNPIRRYDVTPELLALKLAAIGSRLEGPPNFERCSLADAVLALARGDLVATLQCCEEGLNHAFRPNFAEERPETWLLWAIRDLLLQLQGEECDSAVNERGTLR